MNANTTITYFGGELTSLIIVCEVFLTCSVNFYPFDASMTSTKKINATTCSYWKHQCEGCVVVCFLETRCCNKATVVHWSLIVFSWYPVHIVSCIFTSSFCSALFSASSSLKSKIHKLIIKLIRIRRSLLGYLLKCLDQWSWQFDHLCNNGNYLSFWSISSFI